MFQDPTQSGNFYSDNINALMSQDPTAASKVFSDAFAGGVDPSMAAHYDRAVEKTGQDLNRELAAQGMMGSAFGGNAMADAVLGLRAQQAKDESDYSLKRAGLMGNLAQGADAQTNQRYATGGQLARSADQMLQGQTGLGAEIANMSDANAINRMGALGSLGSAFDQNSLAQALGFGNLALGAQGAGTDRLSSWNDIALNLDKMDLSKVLGGMGSASEAQGLGQGRAQGALDNTFRQQESLLPFMYGGLMDQVQGNQALIDSALAATLGASQADVASSHRDKERLREDAKFVLGGIGDIKSLAE
jgi:hypothetical protein